MNDVPAQPASPKSNEWYTPRKYVEAAREVMGSIDLDPASCEQANEVVRATRFYSKEQNGLMQPWSGNVWCNPPYGRTRGGVSMSHQKAFAQKTVEEYKSGRIKQAILLSLGNANSTWFQPLLDFLVCFVRGTIWFTRPDGSLGHFGFPLAFVYLGANEARFIEVFSRFGRIARAIDTPPAKPTNLELWNLGETA